MNFQEWWSAYNREQIFEKNYSLARSMAIKALAEEAFNAGRDAWREVVSRNAPLSEASTRLDITQCLCNPFRPGIRLGEHSRDCPLYKSGG